VDVESVAMAGVAGEEVVDDVEIVDCRGAILSPGYIDLQLNGAYGIDFSSVVDDDDRRGGGRTGAVVGGGGRGRGGGLDAADVLRVSRKLVETGVTSFCPTMVSSSRITYINSMNAVRDARDRQLNGRIRERKRLSRRRREEEDEDVWDANDNCNGAHHHEDDDRAMISSSNILGMHLEGPFFAPTRNGAHDSRHVVSPALGINSIADVYGLSLTASMSLRSEDDDDNVDDAMMPTLDDVDIVTLAPELPGAQDIIRYLTGRFRRRSDSDDDEDKSACTATKEIRPRRRPRPVVVSLGHTEATYADGQAGLSCGATLITHLYNAMESFHHRSPGLAGLLSSPCELGRMGLIRPYYGIIVDGVHVHECAVRMAYRAHPSGCVLVTDAMAAMGLDNNDKAVTLGSVDVIRSPDGDRAVVNDGLGTTLAGSVASMDECVRRFRMYVDCPIGEALLCATLHPATVLGRHILVGECDGAEDDHNNYNVPIGILEVGARADVLMLDDHLVVLATWVGGRLAYQRKSVA
jgi:N-acetylglucosamine-6-phosphate deacetylase